MLFLPGFLGNCCCYLGTALVQHGVLQWSQLFIVQEKHQSVLTGTYVLQCNKCSERICFLMSFNLAIIAEFFFSEPADYEMGSVPFQQYLLLSCPCTYTTKDIYCLKNNLTKTTVWYVFHLKCALSFDHD